ncbi:hypothetical protein BGX28_000691 [Mortierella sp. GBA30]|nr:hypothetical protein BGX28_000691 [Mortierella sp. GBA30]
MIARVKATIARATHCAIPAAAVATCSMIVRPLLVRLVMFIVTEDVAFNVSASSSLAASTMYPSSVVTRVKAAIVCTAYFAVLAPFMVIIGRGTGRNQHAEECEEEEDGKLNLHDDGKNWLADSNLQCCLKLL